MKHFHASRHATLLSLVLAAGCCVSAAVGQTQQPTKPAVAPTATPALKGPDVKDRNVPGVAPDFGMTVEGKRRFADRMPPEIFRKALGVLTAADAPADIRATDEQRETFRTSVEGFEQQVREYRKSHASEIAELRKAAGEIGPAGGKERPNGKGSKDAGGGGGGGSPNEMSGPGEAMKELTPDEQKQRDEARVKLRTLMEGAPKIEAVYTQVWASLSDPQKKAVETKLDEYKAEQAKNREEAYVRQRAAKKAPQPVDGSTAKPSEVAPERPVVRPNVERSKINPERRERLMRFFEQLSPEEQEQLLNRLEERFKDRVPGEKPGEPGKARRQPKPAPNPDEVKVPSPDEKK